MRGVLTNKDTESKNPYIKYATELNLSDPPTQTERANDKQVKNSEGGYVYEVTDMDRFKRFLVLGSEKGTYYINEKELTRENCRIVIKLIKEGKGVDVVKVIREYSMGGRCPKQSPIIFALAMCCRLGDLETKREGYNILDEVCRIPTHLFMFISYCEVLSETGTGWGRAHRRAIKRWYEDKSPRNLVYLVTKYQNREGWSHRDVLRLAHIKARDVIHNIIYHYIVSKGEIINNVELMEEEELDTLDFLRVIKEVKREGIEEGEVIEYIKKYRLAREHIPNVWFSSVKVWEAMVIDMPITSMIRNLGKMTSIGLFNNGWSNISRVVSKITNEEVLRKGRVHPLVILNALNVYKAGKGDKGSLTWSPEGRIMDGLNDSFYKAFNVVEKTNKRWLLALDVSSSMSWENIAGMSITPRIGSAALALITASIEECDIVGFSHELRKLDISPRRRLDDVVNYISNIPMGRTDCSLPMMYAIDNRMEVDVFVIYTDSETYCGNIHPDEALRKYRVEMNRPNAKLIVVGMTSNGFTIANPEDKGMLDIVGFDSGAPEVMRQFVMEEI